MDGDEGSQDFTNEKDLRKIVTDIFGSKSANQVVLGHQVVDRGIPVELRNVDLITVYANFSIAAMIVLSCD